MSEIAFVRTVGNETSSRKFGPRIEGQPARTCPACLKWLAAGDYTTLVAVGPGDNEEARERCREGRPYNAVAVEVHWACATGEQP